ncbi:MAG: radical SAM family heme chaperone HemW [Muribaculaceae bacterium]|nr:radical SAM family heme chaperone HemW [Muribaculaceae bacterium]
MAGVYVHIPFCMQRCVYCDFYSTIDAAWQDTYVDTLIDEARHRHCEIRQSFKTLYVGGGTPSQLKTDLMSRLVKGLREALPLDDLEEFTVEVNPDDVTGQYARFLVDRGVNRVSMGVQSFVDDELRLIRRRHDAQAARLAVKTIRDAGINNISIDLIYGIPGQTLDSWRYSVDEAIALGVQHISAYNLSYEKGTPLWNLRASGEVAELDDDTCVAMYQLLVKRLKSAGYEHYEISNFAQPGFHSRHNSAYWDGTPYLGLGAAAHSFDGEVRRYNPADLQKYLDRINEQGIAYDEERLTAEEQYDETVMLALRTARGLDTAIIHDRFGQDTYDYLMRQARQHIDEGRLTALGGQLRLTPEAVMLADAIIRDLFL